MGSRGFPLVREEVKTVAVPLEYIGHAGRCSPVASGDPAKAVESNVDSGSSPILFHAESKTTEDQRAKGAR
jgi:hypothetical protein